MSNPINQYSREADIREQAVKEARQHIREYWLRRRWCKCSPPVPGYPKLGQKFCVKCGHGVQP